MAYDIIGNIAILKQTDRKLARKILKERPSVKSVYVKSDKVRGRLRTIKVRWLAGEKNLEAVYIENNCKFKLNIEKCYFSGRLSGEREEIARLIRKNDKVLVLFGGVAPYAIVIGKLSKAGKIVNVEISKGCCKYAKENIKLNKLDDKIDIIQGDVKKLTKLLKKQKFDKIIMPRPQIKESFLSYVLPFAKKGTIIYYYDFGRQDELGKIFERVKKGFGKRKYKIVAIKRAGEIAPYKFRFRIDLIVG